ncbi:hypothetical protein Tco_0819989 [Tanacetum coccineum]|uniref:Uncharacterized protein n=1 Tax=Tanacetum coccineum TaxID=301880 RepID=A0ABQ5A842_9ASTR
MVQQQHAADVHPDELCPPNKRYDLLDANKKVDLEHEKIKDKLKFMLDKKELSITLDDFRTIFHLPQATNNNHNSFVPPPSFSDMIPFYKREWDLPWKLKTILHSRTLISAALANITLQVSLDGAYSIPRNDESNIPGTRIEPKSNKESSEVEITKDKEVEILIKIRRREEMEIIEEIRNSPITTPIRSPREYTNLIFRIRGETPGKRKSFDTLADNLHDVMVETLPTMVDKHIKEQVMKQVPEQVQNQVPVYVAEGLILERQKAKEETERLIAKAILQERGNIQAQISTQIENAIANVIPSQVDASVRSYMSGHILHVHPAQSQTSSVPDQQYQLYLAMKADPQLQQQDIAIWLALQMKFERNTVPQTACRTPAVRPRDQDDPHDDAHPEGENSAKRQKTSEYEAYVSGESSSGQVFQEEQAPSTSGNQEQDDDFDFWTDSYALDDDEIPTKQVSQDIMEEVSLTMDEAKLRKMADEMLRQRCTSGDMCISITLIDEEFLKSDIETERAWKTKGSDLFELQRFQVVKTYWELGHEHKFITEIVARRANKYLVSITEPDYKNLNKNDIEDIYLLIMNGKVPRFMKNHDSLWSLSVSLEVQ